MPRFQHLMIDLETLSTGSNAVICSIAAVPFDPNTGETGQAFHLHIDIQSCLDQGLQVQGDTIYWWLEKSKEAQMALCYNRNPLDRVLQSLKDFVAIHLEEDFEIWSKGPSFDMSKLKDAYVACEIVPFWKHWKERCVRTAISGYEELVEEHVPFEGIKHDAEADARHQIRQLKWVYTYNNTPIHGT